jgi:hypothetical protein
MSANTAGAVAWSDGYVFYRMLPLPPPISRCAKCRAFFWTADAKELGYLEDSDMGWGRKGERPSKTPKDWIEAPRLPALDEDQLFEAIESDVARDAQQMIYLRRLCLWARNEPYRNRVEEFTNSDGKKIWRVEVAHNDASRANLEALLPSTMGDEMDLIANRAELMRSLSRFDEAIELFESCASIKSPVIELLTDAARRHDASLYQVMPLS